MALTPTYVHVVYDPAQQEYTVRVVQHGRVTSAAVVRTITTVAVIAKQLHCSVYTEHHELKHALKSYGVSVMTDTS
jgi:hypothetical protein